MKLATNNFIQRAIEEELQRPARPLPEGWPAEIRCPNCKRTVPATAYKIIAKAAPDMNDVAICKDRACRHIFSPRPAYFQAAPNQPATAPPALDEARRSPQEGGANAQPRPNAEPPRR